MISREEVLTACQQGADSVWAIIAHLQQQLAEKDRHIQTPEEEIRLLIHPAPDHCTRCGRALADQPIANEERRPTRVVAGRVS